MKKLLFLLLVVLLLVCSAPSEAAYAFVASVASGSPDTFSHTSGNMDSTGADTIVCYVPELESQGNTTFSDSKSNTWFQLTEQKDVGTASLLGRMYYCKNCNVGSGHNFTVTDTSGGAKGSVACSAWSGGHLTSPLDQQTGNVDIDAGLSNTTGSITPSEDNELVCTGLAFVPNSATISVDGSYTISDQIDATVNHMGAALACAVQTTATASNRTWSYTSNEYVVTTIASFKMSSGGGGGGAPPRGMLLGVGP